MAVIINNIMGRNGMRLVGGNVKTIAEGTGMAAGKVVNLTLADGTVSDEIVADLRVAQQHKQSIIDQKNEENLRAMTHGIVIPGKETAEGDEEEHDEEKSSEEM